MEGSKRSVRAWVVGMAVLAAASLGSRVTLAADTYWLFNPATSGDFDIPANWSNGVPSTSGNYQSGYIENGGTVLLNIALPFSIAGLTIDGGSTLDQSAGTLTSTTPGVQVITGRYILEGTGVLISGVSVGAPLAGDGTIVSKFDMHAGSVTSVTVGNFTGTVGLFHLTAGTVNSSLALGGSGGTGNVVQDGGTVNGLVRLGDLSVPGTGNYTLNAGTINVSQLQLFTSTATFIQAGGSVTTATYTANKAGATYTLSGGSFSADNFTLTGGTFIYSGGTMSINKTASIGGTLNFAGAASDLTLGAGGYYDLSGATLLNTGNATVSAGTDALVIFANGFDPQTAFAGYNNAGWTHVLGTTFVIPAGRTFTPPVKLTTSTFPDPIDVYGNLQAPLGKGMTVQNGLIVRSGSQVDLGTGSLFAETVNTYRVEGGTLATTSIQAGYVDGQGKTPTVFTQAGGTITTPNLLVNGGNYLLQGGTLNVTTGLLQRNTNSTLLQSAGDAYFGQLTAQATTNYALGGGMLTIGTAMTFKDPGQSGAITLDFSNGNAILEILNGATADLSGASILNSLNATILAGQDTTIKFPTGFNPVTQLASYQTGLSLPAQPPTLYVVAGQTLQIAVENTHLDVAGAVVAAAGTTASINQGVFVHDGGSVNINGGVTVPDGSSGISSGTLTANTLSVGSGGTGLFTQSGGSVLLNASLSLDNGGNYVMTGGTITGTPSGAPGIAIGTDNGAATFSQTGGSVDISGALTVNTDSDTKASSYALGGTATIHAFSLAINRAGLINQTGGTVTLDSNAALGSSEATQPAVYQINNGSFTTPTLTLNDNGRFQQTGGTVTASSLLSIRTNAVYNYTANYTISGGHLSATELDLGESDNSQGIGTQPDGYLEVDGGQVDVGWLRLFASGYLHWTSGNLNLYSLQFAGNGSVVGTVDMGHQSGTVTINNAFVDLRGGGKFINAQDVDLVFGPNTLVLLPSTFDSSVFHSLTMQGVNATDNNPLTIPAGTTLTLGGHIEPYLPAQSITLIVQGNLMGFTDPAKPVLDVTARMSIAPGATVNLGVVKAYQTVNGIEEVIGDLNASQVNLNSGSTISGNLTATYVHFDSTTQDSGTLTASIFGNSLSGGYTLSGTGVVQSDASYIQVGTMTQSGGAHNTWHLSVDSEYVLSDGTIHAHDAVIGEWDDDDLFTMNGGSLTADNQVVLGENSTAVGTMTMTAGSIQTPTLILGNLGKGILNANGGSIQITGTGDALILGNAVNTSNPVTTLTINGSAVTVPNGTSEIGLAEKAAFNLLSGSFSTQRMVLGENGTATVTQYGGTLVVAQALYVGPSMGLHSAGETPDSLTVSGGALTAGTVAIGQNGPGQMTINGSSAAVNVSGGVVVGTYGNLSLSAGSLSAATLDTSGTPANFSWTGGTLIVTGPDGLTLGGSGPLGPILSLAGGKVLMVTNALTIESGSSFSAAGGTLQAGSLVVHGAVSGGFTAKTLATSPDTSLSLTLGTPDAPTSETHITAGVSKPAQLQFAASAPGDIISVSGKDGLSLNGGTIQFTTGAGAASLGYYKIIQYTGSFSGSLDGIVLPPQADGVVYLLDATHDPGFIDVHRGFLGDANDDGIVNINDFGLLSQNFGKPGGWGQANFFGDATVNINDFGAISQHFGQSILSGSSVATAGELAQFQSASASFLAANGVPEPTSLALLGIGAAALLAHRRRQA